MSRKVFDKEAQSQIGSRIREIRGRDKQTKFAEKIGTSRSVLSNYEAGRRLPSSSVLARIAQLGLVPVNYILTGEQKLPNMTRPNIVTSGSDNEWAYAVVLSFYEKMKDSVFYLDQAYTRLWWGTLFVRLLGHYESVVFSIAEQNDVDFSIAAQMAMKQIQECDEDELHKLIDGLETQIRKI